MSNLAQKNPHQDTVRHLSRLQKLGDFEKMYNFTQISMEIAKPLFLRKLRDLMKISDSVQMCLTFACFKLLKRIPANSNDIIALSVQCLRTLTGHTGGVWCSQMAAVTVVSGSTDRTLRVWDAESGECVHTLYGHTSTVRCMHLHGNR